MIIIDNNNIQILRGKKRSVNVGWIKMFSCRSILFYVLYVTIAFSPVAYGQYNNLIM